MNDFNKYLAKQMKNEEFRKEWEKSEVEYQIARDLIKNKEKVEIYSYNKSNNNTSKL